MQICIFSFKDWQILPLRLVIWWLTELHQLSFIRGAVVSNPVDSYNFPARIMGILWYLITFCTDWWKHKQKIKKENYGNDLWDLFLFRERI